MLKVNELLSELTAQNAIIVKQYIDAYQTDPNPGLIDRFKREIAETGTMIFHKSIMEGVDNQLELIKGVQKINLDAACSFMDAIQ